MDLALKVIIAAIIVTVALSLTVALLLYDYALNPNAKRKGLFKDTTGESIEKTLINIFDTDTYDAWVDSFDGKKLHALVKEQEEAGHRWVITVHGYTGESYEMGYRVAEFYKRGFNILAPDNRGHGKSEGKYIGMGWHDRLDVMKWIDYINTGYPGSTIILYGISMGGATVMMTAGEKLPDNVRLIIEDCGYSSVSDEFRHEAKFLFRLPYFPVVMTADLVTRIKAGYGFKEASSVKQVKKATVPMLFIHGARDRFVPTSMVYDVYEAAGKAGISRDLMVVDGAGHAESMIKAPEKYWEKVFGFIEVNIKKGP